MVLILVTIIIIYWESHTPKHCPMFSCVRRKKSPHQVRWHLPFYLFECILLLYVDDFDWTFGGL